MWIITRTGFVSCVEHATNPDLIRVRARRREHLSDTFELFDRDIIDLGENAPDYRWHADVPRFKVAQALYDAVLELNYTSHVKEEVSGSDDDMYRAMLACWTALYRLQKPVEPVDTDWWRPSYTVDGGGVWRAGGDPTDGDIAEQSARIASAMLVDAPLTKRVWGWGDDYDDDDCVVCGNDLQTGDSYVIIPEDEFDEPPGPAHVDCAEEAGWAVS